MSTMGRYRYWGDQKPDTSRPLLTLTRPQDAVSAAVRAGDVEQPTSTGTLRIYGPIDSYGGWWGVSSKEVAQALDLLGDAEQIVVRINSPGGETSEGRAIVNLLRAHKAEIVTVVDGAAYSAASYIAACGDQSVMGPGTTLMIHDTSTYLYGNAAALRKAADVIDVLSNSGAELYAEIAGGTVEEWRERQKAETWYTAASAVESGLMQRVGVVPDGGTVETAGEDPEVVDRDAVEERARASYDLSLFDQAPEGLHNPPAASADGNHHTRTGTETAMAFTPEQLTTMRQELGLAENADEATIVAALSESLAEQASDTPAAPTTAPAVPEGMTLIETGVLADLRAGAEDGRAARRQQATERRDAAIQAAIETGRIAPARQEHYEAAWAGDPEGTATLLTSLAPGLVPLAELGHDQANEANTDDAFESAHAAFLAQQGINTATKEA